jgi:hypothetical protein
MSRDCHMFKLVRLLFQVPPRSSNTNTTDTHRNMANTRSQDAPHATRSGAKPTTTMPAATVGRGSKKPVSKPTAAAALTTAAAAAPAAVASTASADVPDEIGDGETAAEGGRTQKNKRAAAPKYAHFFFGDELY